MRIGLAIGTTLMAATLVVPGAFGQATTRRIITNGEAPYLGIGVKDIDSDSAKKLNLKEVRGVEITQVEENSPAAKAGLKEGDVVLEFNGQRVEGGEQLSRFVRETPIGREVKLGVWRNGGMQTLSATTERHRGMVFANGRAFAIPEIPIPNEKWESFRMPEMNMPGFAMIYNSPMIGIVGEALASESQLADFFGVKDGVLVKSVNKNSAAEKAGIKAGDVIVKVDDTKIEKSGDIGAALRAARTKKQVTVTVVRAKKEMPVTVTIESPAPMGTPVRAGMVVGPGWIQVGGTHVGWGPIVVRPGARVVYQ
jgi:serine protease Do